MSETVKLPEIVVISAKPPEAEKPPENGGGGGDDKSISKLLDDLFKQQSKEAVDLVKQEIHTSNNIQDNKNRQITGKWAIKIQNIINAVKDPAHSTEAAKVPALARAIIGIVPVRKVNEISSPLLYTFLEATVNPHYDWESATDLRRIANDIFMLRTVETEMARVLLEPFYAKLVEKGTPEAELAAFKDFLHPVVKTADQVKKDKEAMQGVVDIVFSRIHHFSVGDRMRESIEARAMSQYGKGLADGSMSRESYDNIVSQMLSSEALNLHGEVAKLYHAMHDARTPEERRVKTLEYRAAVGNLQNKGMITDSTKRELDEIPDLMKNYFEMVDSAVFSGRGFAEQVKGIATLALNEDQNNLLNAMSDADSFEKFILDTTTKGGVKRYMNAMGQVNWRVFYGEIKDIFEEILSVADSKPNQFHQEAFNPMYEGHLYSILLKQIDRLGVQLKGNENSKIKNMKIWFEDITSHANEFQSVDPNQPRDLFRCKQWKETDFATAMQMLLVNRMTNLKQVREHLHNIQAICNLGLGWEQLSQYSDRLGIHAIDWYYHEDPELGKAYELYMTSLEDEVTMGNGVIRTDFGHPDDLTNLSPTARRALFQMVSYLKQEHPELKDKEDQLIKRARQKLSAAAAVSQGVTGEFWATLMTGRMPIGYEHAKDKDGNDILVVKGSYLGTESAGYEKMIAQLDLDLLLERFGLPKYFNQFRYAFQPRDLDDSPDPYGKDGRFLGQHGNVYKVAKMAQNAYFRGSTDEMIDFDKKFVILRDYLKTNCVGLFQRGGWRFVNWESHCVPRDGKPGPEGYKNVDFDKTLTEMQRVGSYVVKKFLDEISSRKDYLSVKKMTREEVVRFTAGKLTTKAGADLTEADLKTYFSKEALYQNVLFEQIANVRPSHYLRLERRRYTPETESMIKDELIAFLKRELIDNQTTVDKKYHPSIVEDEVYKMYVCALGLAEKATWWQNRMNGDTDYKFGIADIVRHEIELKDFFKQYKQKEVGQSVRSGGDVVQIIENENEAFEMLKRFYGQLDTSIHKVRWMQNDHSKGEETLQSRFARYLATGGTSSLGEIAYRLGGSDFDMSEFYFSAGGDRSPARMMGETHNIAKDMNPALGNIINKSIPELVKRQYKDLHEFEQAVEKLFAEDLKKVHTAISMMDKDQADRYIVQLGVFIGQLIGKDRLLRVKGLGGAAEYWIKHMDPTTSASLMQDFFPSSLDYPTTALDGDWLYAFGHIFMKACNISPREEKPEDYVQAKMFGKIPLPWQRRINKGEEWIMEDKKFLGVIPYKWPKKHIKHGEGHKTSFEAYEKGMGITKATKIVETWGPTLTWAALLIILMMIKNAFDKNKKK